VVLAPGRINIIGEHTDYAGGLCLPAAVNRYLAVATAAADRIALASQGHGPVVAAAPDRIRPAGNWADHPLGVLAELGRDGVPVAVQLAVVSDIPSGAGLSSSAALGVATAVAVMRLHGGGIDGDHVAHLCRRAENRFLGVPSGLMDQVASVHGRRDHALLFDAATEAVTAVPLPVGFDFLVVESGLRRSLRGSKYRDRPAEAAAALALARKKLPALGSLADLDAAEVEALALPEPLNRRARHIASESRRVLEAVGCLENGDVDAMGRLLLASHQSLANEAEVSLPELDALVARAVEAGCAGARLMGAGFGGSVIALARSGDAGEIARRLEADWRVHRVVVVDGTLA
jgi:galactokinase